MADKVNTAQDSSAELAAVCRQQFEEHYGYTAETAFFSPGRINIIGEHIDYNGGLVFPCAIGLGTTAAVGKRTDHKLRLYSHNFAELAPQEFNAEKYLLAYREEQGWCNYPLGMLEILYQEGMELPCGLDIVFFGNLPTGGSGLSSSASLEVLMGCILLHYSGFQLSRERLAVLAQKAENKFCGMHCGIMDQFIIATAQAKKACLLDCASLEYQQIPLELGNCALLIANTKLPRKLQESKYNKRRAECEAAFTALNQTTPFQNKANLCSIVETELPAALALLTTLEQYSQREELQSRVRHVITENGRTHKAAEAMQAGDWQELGALLSASHASLRDDYQVTGEHLDSLVALLEQEDAVLGARMTGAGFGGCAIALLRLSGNKAKDQKLLRGIQQRVKMAYQQQFGWEPEFHLSDAVAGARML